MPIELVRLAWSYAPYVLGALALFLLWKSILLVGGTEIAVMERKYFGASMPQGRVVAMSNEVGIQARTLGPGMHFLIPFLYTATKFPFSTIGENEVGLIESIDGDPVQPGTYRTPNTSPSR